MSSSVIFVLLLALAGFLLGGAYTTWKTAKPLAVALALAGALAVAGAFLWM
ncbi:hypothetical protein LTV02_33445 [Nocardia yamanashiensis]|uniref:hypothetical protein n=1 Tax=Nocardia yamanashiensis TaxID=209247 RepID=UPI000AC603DD|nr:hypothetical protein [Nocardia yamanashiensis]UGT40833.1 hypothetical protein LTV02_33445 [Nocardia yamanashiensis]